MAVSELSLLEVFGKARELNLCPNRLWNAAREDLKQILPDLDSIIALNSTEGFHDYNSQNDHSNCTSTLCEFSRRDFTSVQQRHECSDTQCAYLRVSFRARLLKDAVNKGEITAWSLSRTHLLNPDVRYMAISHVWSDGTGAGPSGDGSLHECLYEFFVGIATKFQCDGIWWDTLCIPRQKAARTKAIRKIETAYENARFTLVHDCFLRNWTWDPETACFAILMSPWFSRGWTALELLKSPKVKVIFRGPHGHPLIKDLDEEILAKESDTDGPRKEASRIIRRLRYGVISTINDLLIVLGSRSTSWPKDIHIIAALLFDIAPEFSQQDTYQTILRKVGRLPPGHLFHNATMMSNSFMWCPAELMEMPLVDSSDVPSLIISNDGDVEGKWRIIALPADLEAKCSMKSMPGLKRLLLKEALTRFAADCWLLAECDKPQIERAIVVREIRKNQFQYLAAVDLFSSLAPQDSFEERTVIILSNPSNPSNSQIPGPIQSVMESEAHSIVSSLTSGRESLHSAIWNRDSTRFNELISVGDQIEAPDTLGRRPLHLAAERGNLEMVKQLLRVGVDPNTQCGHEQTALHRAAWAGSTEIVRLLLENGATILQDKNGNTPLHIAAQMGSSPVLKLLITHSDRTSAKGLNGLTALHFAAMNGHLEAAKLLVCSSDLKATDDHFGWTPLHCAADSGNVEVVRLLLDHGADIHLSDNYVHWTPLHLAAMNGHLPVIKFLLDIGTEPTDFQRPDNMMWTPLKFAEVNGHGQILALFPRHNKKAMSSHQILPYGRFPPDDCFTPLHCRAINNQLGVTQILTLPALAIYKEQKFGDCDWAPLKFAGKAKLNFAIRQFLNNGSFPRAGTIGRVKNGPILLHWAIINSNHALAKGLLQAGVGKELLDASGNRPIHNACFFSDVSMLQILLEAGVETDSRTKNDQENALHIAVARNKDGGVVRLLLDSGLNKEAKRGIDGATPLEIAAAIGNQVAVQQLLTVGASLISPSKHRHEMNAAHAASVNGHCGVLRLLVEAGADIENANVAGQTLLIMASENGDAETVKFLIDSGANIGAVDRHRRNALHYAARSGKKDTVKVLIEAGAEIRALDGDSHSALYYAACEGEEEIATDLIDAGADFMDSIESQKDVLHIAAANGHVGVVQLLIRTHARLNRRDEHGRTLLHYSARDRETKIVRDLIEAGADIRGLDKDEKSALHFASKQGSNLPIVRLLIQAHAQVNRSDGEGWTPLHYAARSGDTDTVKFLIGSGADIHPRNTSGLRPISLAISGKGDEDVVQLLIENGAEWMDSSEESLLFLAVTHGRQELVKMLIQSGASLETTDWMGRTALHWAYRENQMQIAQILIKSGANKKAYDQDFKRPKELRPTYSRYNNDGTGMDDQF